MQILKLKLIGATLLASLCVAANPAVDPSKVPAAAQQSSGPSTQPSLEFRAGEAFNRGEYSVALPLLQKLAVQLKDQPDKVAPILEQVRVCEKQLAMANGVQSVPSNGQPDPTTSGEPRKP